MELLILILAAGVIVGLTILNLLALGRQTGRKSANQGPEPVRRRIVYHCRLTPGEPVEIDIQCPTDPPPTATEMADVTDSIRRAIGLNHLPEDRADWPKHLPGAVPDIDLCPSVRSVVLPFRTTDNTDGTDEGEPPKPPKPAA